MKPQDIQRVIDEHLSGYDPVPRQMDAVRARIRHAQRRKMPVRVVVIAAIILILAALAAIGIASRGEEPIQYFMEYDYDWEDGCIDLKFDEYDPALFFSDEDFTPAERAVWGDEFCDDLRKKKMRFHLPTWIPEGVELTNIAFLDDDIDFYGAVLFSDENEEKTLMLSIQCLCGEVDGYSGGLSFETDGEIMEKTQINGFPVLIYSNLRRINAVWQENNAIFSIVTTYPRETLEKVLESIPQ